jgi:hypothetical protein
MGLKFFRNIEGLGAGGQKRRVTVRNVIFREPVIRNLLTEFEDDYNNLAL